MGPLPDRYFELEFGSWLSLRVFRILLPSEGREEEDNNAAESPLYRFLAIAVEWDEDGELRRVRIVPR